MPSQQMSSTPPIADPSVSNPHDESALFPQVLELFPDISHVYVEELLSHHSANVLADGQGDTDTDRRNRILCQVIIKESVVEEILANPSYPKQKQLKRKRDGADEADEEWGTSTSHHGDFAYLRIAIRVLTQEFPHIPIQFIRQTLSDEDGLYQAYLALTAQENSPTSSTKLYERLKRARKLQKDNDPLSADSELPVIKEVQRELDAARKKVEKDAAVIRQQKEKEEAENFNEQEHIRAGTLVECQCCYIDVPSNRAIPCEGFSWHFFCFTCIRKTAETQIGLMKYQMRCFDTTDCQASFARFQLEEALGSSVMEKLDSLQQQDEISRASLEGLEGCPFCEFKAICPPVEENREFRCYNPACEVISCRLCNEESHIPKTCDEAKKDKGLSRRHVVEEAMSEALIRNCPKCKVKIVKELGCNKMTCPKCRCMMCYICKKDITHEQYAHFGRGPNSCAVDDDPSRYENEVEQAEKTTIEKIRAENPNLTQEELRVHHPKKISHISRRRMAPQTIHQFQLHPPPPPIMFNTLYHQMPVQNPPGFALNQAPGVNLHLQPGVEQRVLVPNIVPYPFIGVPNPNYIKPPPPVDQNRHLNVYAGPSAGPLPPRASLAANLVRPFATGTGVPNDPSRIPDIAELAQTPRAVLLARNRHGNLPAAPLQNIVPAAVQTANQGKINTHAYRNPQLSRQQSAPQRTASIYDTPLPLNFSNHFFGDTPHAMRPRQ